MGLHETTKHMRDLLCAISVDLEKSASGNKAAAQRVRTGTIRLEKIAKHYRKESISSEKHGGSRKQQKKAPAKAKSKATKAKAQPKKSSHAQAKRQMMMKRPTAKIPVKKA